MRNVTDSNPNPLFGQQAVEIARRALEELDEGGVGEHLGFFAVSGAGNVATLRFSADLPGYPGWEWHAVVACASGAADVTVNEVALVPGNTGQALQAPDWVPYADRVRPGDLGPGDVFPPEPDDPRIANGTLTRASAVQPRARWRDGDFGPHSEMATQARLKCRTCAFFLPAGDEIGPNFGVCANKFSADGRVVHAAYGCGAHSETRVDTGDDFTPGEVAFDDEEPLY